MLQDPSRVEMKEGITCSRSIKASKLVFTIQFLHGLVPAGMALPPGTVSSGIAQGVSLLAMTIDYVLAGFLLLPGRGVGTEGLRITSTRWLGGGWCVGWLFP